LPHLSPKDLYLALERRIDRYLGPPQLALLSLFAGRSGGNGPHRDPERILLVKLHGIGNVVLMLPAIRQLKARFPKCQIDFLTFRSNAGVLEGVGELACSHFLDRGSPWSLLRSMARTFPELRRRRFDLVIDFDQFAHFSAISTLLAGAPRRVGFRNPNLRRHLGYTTPVVYLDMTHVSKTFTRLARTVGAPDLDPPSRRLALDPEHRAEAVRFLERAGIGPGERFAILHPGSSENLVLRRWPAERFSRLGDRLAAELDCRIVISGGGEEKALAATVIGDMRENAVSSAGELSVRGFAALCEKAAFIVSNDTASVHIASAMGTPVVGLYGPNTPMLYGPLGDDDIVFYHELPCSPCLCNLTSKLSGCRHAICMESIMVDEVFEAIRERYFPDAAASPETAG
jgi:lipopolysaccharide heptosyltransferase II